ncbi:MAG: chromate transporter [Chloroflexi bacterium]|nr:chromate transporter [Chloroflexota bacterium]
MSPLEFFLIFLKASAITFTGMGSLPILQQELVQFHGWTTDEQIAKAVAIGRLSPGPNGMYAVSIGYVVMGWLGALLALLGSVLPPLIIIPLAPLVRRSIHRPWVDGLMRGIGLGSAGLLLSVGVGLVAPNGFSLAGPGPWNLALAVLGFALTRTGKLHPAIPLGVAGVAGVVLSMAGL